MLFRSDIDDLSGKIKMPELEGKIMDNTRTEKIVYINIVVPAASGLIDYHYHQVIIIIPTKKKETHTVTFSRSVYLFRIK